MKIEGQHTYDAARATVWRALMDPQVIARIMPGCESLEVVGENAFEGAMKIKVGPVQGTFKGEVALSDLVEPESYRLAMKGKGAPGFVEADGVLTLHEDGGQTRLEYAIDAKIGGRIASVGQRLLESSTKVIARQSLEGLGEQIAALEAEAPAPPPAASQGKLAAGFLTGLLAELLPAPLRPYAGVVYGGLGIVLLVVVVLIFRSCAG